MLHGCVPRVCLGIWAWALGHVRLRLRVRVSASVWVLLGDVMVGARASDKDIGRESVGVMSDVCVRRLGPGGPCFAGGCTG